MLSANSIMQILDTHRSVSYEESMYDIFLKYIEYTVENLDNSYTFIPAIGSLKIRDLQGWTDIIKITIFHNHHELLKMMYKIEVENHQPIFMDKDQYIPVYDGENKIGFHGEVKYHVQKEKVSFFKDNEISKLRTDKNEFITSKRVIEVYRDDPTFNIETKSGFFNANGIHLLGENNFCEKLYK